MKQIRYFQFPHNLRSSPLRDTHLALLVLDAHLQNDVESTINVQDFEKNGVSLADEEIEVTSRDHWK